MPPPLRGLISIALIAGFTAFAAPSVAATVIGGGNYVRVTPGEDFSVAFADADGFTTGRQYSGLVEVIVSGIGQSFGTRLTDAFYYAEDGYGYVAGQAIGNGWYELGMTAEGEAPLGSNLTRIRSNIVYIEGLGDVTGGSRRPAYSADHVYRFVVDVSALNGGNPGTLIFGPNDGNYRDNSGKFDITLYQLGTSAVPEPATWAMMITGFGLAGMAVRRRRLAPKSALT